MCCYTMLIRFPYGMAVDHVKDAVEKQSGKKLACIFAGGVAGILVTAGPSGKMYDAFLTLFRKWNDVHGDGTKLRYPDGSCKAGAGLSVTAIVWYGAWVGAMLGGEVSDRMDNVGAAIARCTSQCRIRVIECCRRNPAPEQGIQQNQERSPRNPLPIAEAERSRYARCMGTVSACFNRIRGWCGPRAQAQDPHEVEL